MVTQVWLYALGQNSKHILDNVNPVLIRKVPKKNALLAKIANFESVWLAICFFKKTPPTPPIGDFKNLGFQLILNIAMIIKKKRLNAKRKKYFKLKVIQFRRKRSLGFY